ncbi:MAG TPA: hypothetical protein VNH18_14810 [Bryobacteraceae bacterium]|nr:hypothetical protein [Bryobacteraceae bacterium]
MSQKSTDRSAIPLCFWCHTGDNDSYHHGTEAEFAARKGIDILAIVADLSRRYDDGEEPAWPQSAQ